MKSVAIIPARGGSKRIPRKNIRDFLGKPIIAYSIESALNSGLFDEVMVSTEDEEIADVAKKFGAKVPFFRGEKNADDFATLNDVLIEVLEAYSRQGKVFETACCILPTSPLISIENLKEGWNLLQKNVLRSVLSACEFSYPIWRGLKKNGESAEMIWPENLTKRSQDLPATFHDAGQFYWFKTKGFSAENSFFGKNMGMVVLKPEQVQDIDSEEDWKMAELKAEWMRREK